MLYRGKSNTFETVDPALNTRCKNPTFNKKQSWARENAAATTRPKNVVHYIMAIFVASNLYRGLNIFRMSSVTEALIRCRVVVVAKLCKKVS